jgi:PhnB protein
MKLGATLYIRNTIEAVALYQQAFGLTLGYHEKFEDGTYMHATFCEGSEEVFAISECRNDAFVELMLKANLKTARPAMSYGLTLESAQAVEKAFELLKVGGNIMMPLGTLPWSACCAEVIDRYGIYWYLTV